MTATLLEEPMQCGPCSEHATINCLQCYDINLEDLDDDGYLIVVDGESLRNHCLPLEAESDIEQARR